jgi:hypothetical protein
MAKQKLVETFDVEGRNFYAGQEVRLKIPWAGGTLKDAQGVLKAVHGSKAYVRTARGLVEGYSDTMEAAEQLIAHTRRTVMPRCESESKTEVDRPDRLAAATDLLGRAAARLRDEEPPDARWWKEYFVLTRTPMVLTDEGWMDPNVVPHYREINPEWKPLDEVRFDD